MKKKMTIRKKSLAIILSLMMAVCALSGCTLGNEPAVVEDGDSLEIPEVKGKEETVGAFTLLVPKGMSADEQGSESCIKLVDDEDEDKYLLIQVAEKDEAKEYVKTLMEEDENYSDESFTIADVKWTGASYKKAFVLYGKIDKKVIFVTSEGYKPTDDIPVAVLASLQVDEDAESVGIQGASKGGTFTYGDGLYTVEYSGFYRLAENSELGDLIATDGSQTVYVTAFDNTRDAIQASDEIEEFDYKEEDMTVAGYDGVLYTYEDFFGDTAAEFFLPMEYEHVNGSYKMVCIYIHTTADDYETAVNDEFMALINSLEIDDTYMTDVEIGGSSSGGPSGGNTTAASDAEEYWERGWYGWWIVYDACSDYSDNIGYAYDCLATFDVDGDEVHWQLVDADGDQDIDLYMDLLSDSTVSGWLLADHGDILGYDIDYAEFMIDPESDSQLLDDYISFTVKIYDDNGDYVITMKGFLRPWGADWDEFYELDVDDLPEICVNFTTNYADMFAFNYDDWYVGMMNKPFPGLWASQE